MGHLLTHPLICTSVGSALPDAIDSASTFVQLGPGGLTGGVVDLSNLTNSLKQSVGTYMLAAAAQEVGFVITRTAGVDVHALQTNSSAGTGDLGCANGYDSIGICGPWYFDGTDTYSLVNQNDFQQDESNLFQTSSYCAHYHAIAMVTQNIN